MTDQPAPNVPQTGDRNPVIIGLLFAIAVLLTVLIVAVVATSWQRGGSTNSSVPPPLGRNFGLEPGPKPIDDPDRIRETLQPGKTYVSVVKASFDARVEDKAWAINKVANLAYEAEMEVERTIESNDGRVIVERRSFVRARNVKLLYDVEGVTIEMGAPGVLLLEVLDTVKPGTKEVLQTVKPLAERLLKSGVQPVMKDKLAKAVGYVDGLSGKAVRITYVDGQGVTDVEPLECELSEAEDRFIRGTAVLSDCYIWDFKKAPGSRWDIDASQLSGIMDPSLLGLTHGAINVVREADETKGVEPYAMIRVEGGEIKVNASDENNRRIGTFRPSGMLRFSQTEKIVAEARLRGQFTVDQVSKNHLLFETSFRSRPVMTVDYTCKRW